MCYIVCVYFSIDVEYKNGAESLSEWLSCTFDVTLVFRNLRFAGWPGGMGWSSQPVHYIRASLVQARVKVLVQPVTGQHAWQLWGSRRPLARTAAVAL